MFSTLQVPPIETKPKPPKSRRQSAPSKSRRRAPPPPVSTLSQTKEVPSSSSSGPKHIQPSPRLPRTSTSSHTPAKESERKGSEDSVKAKDPTTAAESVAQLPTSTGILSASGATPPAKVASGKQQVKVKRRTTTVDNLAKPRRRPPPPMPQPLLEASKETSTTAPKTAVSTGKPKPVVDSKSEMPLGTPIPPPRKKARMKKVKRPTSRTIPPPPDIPLPPPPSKKVSPLTSTIKATDSAQQDKPTTSSDAVAGPAGLGQPVHSSARTVVESKDSATSRGLPKGHRPPPPRRISSLMPMTPVEKEKREVKSDHHKSSKLTPPKRPPPPKPTSAISNQPAAKPERPGRPPSATKKSPEPEAVGESERTIQPRGSKLMSSLKKMVKRNSKKEIKADQAEDGAKKKPQRPAQPPNHSSSGKEMTSDQVSHMPSEDSNTPVPKPRSKKKSSISSANTPDTTSAPPTTSPQQSNTTATPSPSTSTTTPGGSVPADLAAQAPSPIQPSQQPPSQPAAATATPDSQQEPTQVSRSATMPPPRPSQAPQNAPSSKETSALPPQHERRKSSNIPSKPPPPATVSSTKPKPPLAPKPSLLSLAPKPETKTLQPIVEQSTPDGAKSAKPSSNGRDHTQDTPANFYRATKDYSSKSEDELSFSVGDVLIFIDKQGKSGFYQGMLDTGITGLFPTDCVEPFLK